MSRRRVVNRRRRAAIRRRNRNRIVVFSLVMVLSVVGVFSLVKRLPFFKKDVAVVEQRKDVGGDATVKPENQEVTSNVSEENKTDITKQLNNNNSEDLKQVVKMTESTKDRFTDKLQKIYKTVGATVVYSSTNENSTVVTEIPMGDYLESYGSENGWVKVNYQNQDGYVKLENVTKIEDEKMFKVVDGVLIVNREYRVPEDFNPGLKLEAKQSYELMRDEMRREGLDIKIISDYRSYDEQRRVYDSSVEGYGKEAADEMTSLPGHSEHQTGYAFDFWTNDDTVTIDDSFDNTAEAEWLAKNAYKYGFILRYPRGKEAITGYKFESWHYRFVGPELAKKVFDSGLTLEEYFGL